MRKWAIVLASLGGFVASSIAQPSNSVSLKTPDPYAITTEEPAQRDFSQKTPVFHAPRLSLGVNYTGAQVRWNLARRWAIEGRYQRGTASSDYGTVTAQVFGLRGYRFFHSQSRWPLYLGGELAKTEAKPETGNYRASGFAAGGFGGFEYRMGSRFALDIDIGPYVINLEEAETGQRATTLDFVLNTALIVRIF